MRKRFDTESAEYTAFTEKNAKLFWL